MKITIIKKDDKFDKNYKNNKDDKVVNDKIYK